MSFQDNNDPIKQHRYIIKDNKNNDTVYRGKNYYIMRQARDTRELWNTVQSIVFESDSIPIKPEALSSTTNQTRRTLFDFEPDTDDVERATFQYNAQGTIRFHDLLSSYPLRQIDLRVYWTDVEGIRHPLWLSILDVLTVKLLFRKKRQHITQLITRIDDTFEEPPHSRGFTKEDFEYNTGTRL